MEEQSLARDFRDLHVWQESIKLAKEVYQLITQFPRDEKYGLTDQIRRAVVSIPSNIAEGQSRRQSGEFRHFLQYSLGSLAEVETQLILAQEFGYLTTDEYSPINIRITNVRKMLYGLLRTLK